MNYDSETSQVQVNGSSRSIYIYQEVWVWPTPEHTVCLQFFNQCTFKRTLKTCIQVGQDIYF